MKILVQIVIPALFFPSLLSAQTDSTVDLTSSNSERDRVFLGITLDYPVLSWFPDPPTVSLDFLPDSLQWSDYPMEQEIGVGLQGVLGYRLTGDGRLRVALTPGFRYQKGRNYFDGTITDTSGSRPVLFGRMIFSITTLRLGTELQYEVLSWDRPTPFPDEIPPGERPTATVDRWYALLLRAGITGGWRVGSNAEVLGKPDPREIGWKSGTPEGANQIWSTYYNGPIPDLKPLGIELLGGAALEFPIGDQVTGSIGVAFSQTLGVAAPEDWTYRTVEVQGSVGW